MEFTYDCKDRYFSAALATVSWTVYTDCLQVLRGADFHLKNGIPAYLNADRLCVQYTLGNIVRKSVLESYHGPIVRQIVNAWRGKPSKGDTDRDYYDRLYRCARSKVIFALLKVLRTLPALDPVTDFTVFVA